MPFALSMYLCTSKVKAINNRAFIISKIIRFTQFISTIHADDKFFWNLKWHGGLDEVY